jgi:hypothetical protein
MCIDVMMYAFKKARSVRPHSGLPRSRVKHRRFVRPPFLIDSHGARRLPVKSRNVNFNRLEVVDFNIDRVAPEVDGCE